ncbi:uncharacterized protein LOC135491649 [Lineus longissimus]|uniref:uncharacterized protein LOC135491649 n=1 Tax=Lineus longissimus TaxID=88925 RepID=UPI00315DBF69
MIAPPSSDLENYTNISSTTGTYENSSADWLPSDSSRLRELDLPVTIVSILILLVTTLIGTVGNIFVFVAVYSSKLLKTVMNAMLVNLAIGDAVTVVIVAPSLLVVFVASVGGTTLPAEFCSYLDFFHTLGGTVQLVSLVCISYERYQAIADPFEVEEKVRRVKISICFSWTLGLLFACVVTFWVHTTPMWLFCSGTEYDTNIYSNYYADLGLGPVSFLVTFLVLFLYVKILLALKRHLEKKNMTLKKNKVQPKTPKQSTVSDTPAAGLLKTVGPEAKVMTESSTATSPQAETSPKAKKGAIFWKKKVKISPSEKVSSSCNGGSKSSLLNRSVHKSSLSKKRGSFGQASVDVLVMQDENDPGNETIVFVPRKPLTIKNVNNAVSFIKRTNQKLSDTRSGDDFYLEKEASSLLEVSETGSKVVGADAKEPEITQFAASSQTERNTGGIKCAFEKSESAKLAENEMTSSSDNSSPLQSKNTMPLLFKKLPSAPNGFIKNSAQKIEPPSKKDVLEMSPEKPSIQEREITKIASHEKRSAPNSENSDFAKTSSQKKRSVPESDIAGMSPRKPQSVPESDLAGMSLHKPQSVPDGDAVGMSPQKPPHLSVTGSVAGGMSPHKPESVPESDSAKTSPQKKQSVPENEIETVTSDAAIEKDLKHEPGTVVFGKKAKLGDRALTAVDSSVDVSAFQPGNGVHAAATSVVQLQQKPKKQGLVFWKKKARVPEEIDTSETDKQVTANNIVSSSNEKGMLLDGETTAKKQGAVFWKKKAKVGVAVTNVTGEITQDAAGETVSFRPGNKAPPGENQELADTVSFLTQGNNLVDVHDFHGKVMMAAAKTDQVVGSVCVMSDKNKFNGRRKLEGKTAKRASVIIIVFLVCWLPMPIVYLVTGHVTNRYGVQRMINGAEMFCLCLASLTAALNPIVYSLVNKQWRNEFLRLMKKCLKKT